MAWSWTSLLGILAWMGVYLFGRVMAALMGYGLDIGMGDTFAVMIPTILAVFAAIAVWERD